MDWSSRDILAAAWPPLGGAATGGGGAGCVRLMAVGAEAGRASSSPLVFAASQSPIVAVQWDERGDTLFTVDAVGGYVMPLDVSLGARCHVYWPLVL